MMVLSLPPAALMTWNIAQPLKQPSGALLVRRAGAPGPTIGTGTSLPARCCLHVAVEGGVVALVVLADVLVEVRSWRSTTLLPSDDAARPRWC